MATCIYEGLMSDFLKQDHINLCSAKLSKNEIKKYVRFVLYDPS